MNRNAQKTLIVVDNSSKLLGILSDDGDIRNQLYLERNSLIKSKIYTIIIHIMFLKENMYIKT